MNKDKVKGAVDDAVGRAKRQVGEWTRNPNKQVQGAAQQVKGKAEKVWGEVKDAAKGAADTRERRDTDHSTGSIAPDRSRHERDQRDRKAS